MIRLLRKPPASPDDAGETSRVDSEKTRLSRLPPLLLALALSTLFLFNADRERFYASIGHDTGKTLSIAENLSSQHNFRMFLRLAFDQEGEHAYEPYNRFPVGGFALIKLVILPFGDNLAAKIFAARMLMLVFLSAAAFLAYRTIDRIASNKWIALTATTIAFSSYYVLRYSNWVSIEFMVDLFAVMLAFHGMVVFVQEGRFRQLLVKICAALLLGWHAYAFLAPFIILGLGSELIRAMKRRGDATGGSDGAEASGGESVAGAVVRSRYARLSAVALLFGFAVLSFNIFGEYTALNGERSLSELPTVRSMLYRTSLSERPEDSFQWVNFLRGQFTRVVGATFPYAFTNWPGVSLETPPNVPPLPLAAFGVLLTAAPLAGLLWIKGSRLILATLALSGFFWALPMRRNTVVPYHDHEAIYYVGVPLALVTLLLLAAVRFGWGRFLPAVSVGAALLFALSAYAMTATNAADKERAERQEAIYADAANIREIVQGKSVVVAQSTPYREVHLGYDNALNYYFTGSYISRIEEGLPPEYDFVLISHRDESAPLLTPQNEIMFLYDAVDPSVLQRSWVDSVAAGAVGEPAVRSAYDVHIAPGALVYVKEPCGEADIASRFFLHVFPDRPQDLPQPLRRDGYENLTFNFHRWGVAFGGKCAANVPLPGYPVAGVRTGQFAPKGEIWSTAFPLDPAAPRAAYEAAVSREPNARAEFDLYLDARSRSLTYVKEPCAASDVERPFFLHVFPERPEDLPRERREDGFDIAPVDFPQRGAVFDGKCAARVPLPDYPVAALRTGQWIRGEGETWSAEIPFEE